MAKIRSLSGKREFQEIYGKGAKRVGRLVVVYLMESAAHEKGVVASKKVGNAVKRNRAKRLLREAISSRVFRDPDESARILKQIRKTRRTENGDTAEHEGLRIVLVARAAINSAKCQDVCRELTDLLR